MKTKRMGCSSVLLVFACLALGMFLGCQTTADYPRAPEPPPSLPASAKQVSFDVRHMTFSPLSEDGSIDMSLVTEARLEKPPSSPEPSPSPDGSGSKSPQSAFDERIDALEQQSVETDGRLDDLEARVDHLERPSANKTIDPEANLVPSVPKWSAVGTGTKTYQSPKVCPPEGCPVPGPSTSVSTSLERVLETRPVKSPRVQYSQCPPGGCPPKQSTVKRSRFLRWK
ncbi:hypothetical protein VN12_06420 [Pirellula sp. SH-Sr6A]|uniref:hypothetical protein n=1 Tax=Pirellula sp. SH-Sr6A TaxID=1632865 RepID=UPI00078E1860|nr:hypothetical protein [Pirellula sp. SH-Sr6A]AMV31737.1 hypothetical protein VN12_06420 [Pirellula sp. SH-Sr6A]